MIDRAFVCNEYARLYTDRPELAGRWDHVFPTDGCYAAILHLDGETSLLCYRGSVTPLDWFRDMQNAALPTWDPKLGWVHSGFREGVLQNIGWINANLRKKKIVMGHSLGAGHALLFAGYHDADGDPVDELILCGAPRAGGPKLAQVVVNTPISSYRNADANGHDAVTDVPYRITVPFIGGIQYQHPVVMTDVMASPAPGDPWGPFKWHHFGLYCRAFGATSPAALSLPT